MVYKWLDSLLKNKGRNHTIMGKTSRPFPTGHFRLNPKKNAYRSFRVLKSLQLYGLQRVKDA